MSPCAVVIALDVLKDLGPECLSLMAGTQFPRLHKQAGGPGPQLFDTKISLLLSYEERVFPRHMRGQANTVIRNFLALLQMSA